MNLHVIYRSTGPGNRKRRPEFFDKVMALASFLRAAESMDVGPELIFVNDGPIPAERRRMMNESGGRIIDLAGLGNSRSYRIAFDLVRGEEWPGGDLVYFCEDDYLHRPPSLRAMTDAATAIERAAYFTLYDHPDRYAGTHPVDEPAARVFETGGQHWRTVESSCMTFGGRAGALRSDRWIHRLGTVPNTPRDQLIWRATQRLGGFRLVPRRGHVLIAALPALATHCEDGLLAPGIDWAGEAEAARAWAAGRGWPTAEAGPPAEPRA